LNCYAFYQPEEFRFNKGGYQTLNFIPSMATMIFGLMAGEMLRRRGRPAAKWVVLLLAGSVCLLGGLLLDHAMWPDWFRDAMEQAGQQLGDTSSPLFDPNWVLCPVVKRIWTPSWAVFSAGWTFLMLAGFYGVIDLQGWRHWAFPFVVVGMNSIAMYCMAQLMKGWVRDTLKRHLGPNIFDGTYGPIIQSVAVLVVLWLICLWMYRRKIFLRI
jgi:predicted acyltransferase